MKEVEDKKKQEEEEEKRKKAEEEEERNRVKTEVARLEKEAVQEQTEGMVNGHPEEKSDQAPIEVVTVPTVASEVIFYQTAAVTPKQH